MMISDLKLLNDEQQTMEAFICKQEEPICNLNDDNMLFKTKLISFVEYTPTVLSRVHRNNTDKCRTGD
jgi:hypothetical protein